VTLEECCAACAREVGTPPEKPAWNTPRCGAANWKDGACTMMATDPTTRTRLRGVAEGLDLPVALRNASDPIDFSLLKSLRNVWFDCVYLHGRLCEMLFLPPPHHTGCT
jgi:hypothetical protein